MLFLTTIALLTGCLLSPAPEITGIMVIGDTCDITSPISFELSGNSSATEFSWNFDDPGSGSNNTITVSGSAGNSTVSHLFSKPGRYEVHITYQEPGMPESRLCKYVTIGQCCAGSNSTTTIALCANQLPYEWNGKNYSTSGQYTHSFPRPSGCDSIATLVLQVGNPAPTLGNDTTLCPGEILRLNPGNFSSYLWQDQSSTPTYEVLREGQYAVWVQAEGGCTGTDTITVTYENNCSDIFFPTAITPNQDGRNDAFGALGNISGVSNYQLFIYNRFGQVVYQSRDPLQRWEGEQNGLQAANTAYVWKASYSLNRRGQKFRKGNLAVIK